MNIYTVKSPSGLIIDVKGDTPPTDSDLEQIFLDAEKQKNADSINPLNLISKAKDYIKEYGNVFENSEAPLKDAIAKDIKSVGNFMQDQAKPETIVKNTENLITGAETLAPYAIGAVAPATIPFMNQINAGIMGVGETARSLIRGNSIGDALLSGGINAGVSYAGGKLLGDFLPATAKFILKNKSVGDAMSPLAKTMIQKDIMETSKPLNMASEFLPEDMPIAKKLLTGKESPDVIKNMEKQIYPFARNVRKEIIDFQNQLGKNVTSQKEKIFDKSISPSTKIETIGYIKNALNEFNLTIQDLGKKTASKNPKKVQGLVTDREVLKNIVDQVDQLDSSKTYKDAFLVLKNIDSFLDSAYQQQVRNESLKSSQSIALGKRIRGFLSESLSKPDELSNASMAYKVLNDMLDHENGALSKAMASDDKMSKYLSNIVLKGNDSKLKNLVDLDALISSSRKELKETIVPKALNLAANQAINLTPHLYLSTPGLMMQATSQIPKAIQSVYRSGAMSAYNKLPAGSVRGTFNMAQGSLNNKLQEYKGANE